MSLGVFYNFKHSELRTNHQVSSPLRLASVGYNAHDCVHHVQGESNFPSDNEEMIHSLIVNIIDLCSCSLAYPEFVSITAISSHSTLT